ncbi:MAG: YCF48-related protein [Sedimentisphaerales bacterium]|nr:YCF48-related protein [Sedimentisphaerales bacterium]
MLICSNTLSVRRFILLIVFALLIDFAGASRCQAAEVGTPLSIPAILIDSPETSILIDATRAGQRVVAVGERGIIVFSDDNGGTWRQAKVPVSVTLTAVAFPTPQKGWATGHWGVVLHSKDGGETWQVQLDGRAAAALELKAAEAETIPLESPVVGDGGRLTAARWLVEDGPDKPFMDLYFMNDKQGFVVGAYGLFFGTEDGGETWHSCMGRVENPAGSHFYAIDGNTKTLLIVGERGFIARSADDGRNFKIVPSPAKATFFAVHVTSANHVFVGGMEGKAFRSDDSGVTFLPIKFPLQTSVNAIQKIANGRILYATQNGRLFTSSGGSDLVTPLKMPPGAPLTSVVQSPDGSLLTVGLAGVGSIPSTATANTK